MTAFETRPKPPRITAEGRLKYERQHQVIAVYRGPLGKWLVDSPKAIGLVAFPTHAEAVAYAHALVVRGREA